MSDNSELTIDLEPGQDTLMIRQFIEQNFNEATLEQFDNVLLDTDDIKEAAYSSLLNESVIHLIEFMIQNEEKK